MPNNHSAMMLGIAALTPTYATLAQQARAGVIYLPHISNKPSAMPNNHSAMMLGIALLTPTYASLCGLLGYGCAWQGTIMPQPAEYTAGCGGDRRQQYDRPAERDDVVFVRMTLQHRFHQQGGQCDAETHREVLR